METEIGECDYCPTLYNTSSRVDHCWECGNCWEHCEKWDSCVLKEHEEAYGDEHNEDCPLCGVPNAYSPLNLIEQLTTGKPKKLRIVY